MSWRQWWHASWTGQRLAGLAQLFRRAAADSRFLRWMARTQQRVMADRRRLGTVIVAVCAVTALAATLLRPELWTIHDVGVRAALVVVVAVIIQRLLQRGTP